MTTGVSLAGLGAVPAAAAATVPAAPSPVHGIALAPLESIGLFVGVPVGLFLVISLLVLLPAWAKDSRYRPEQPWYGDSEEAGERRENDESGGSSSR